MKYYMIKDFYENKVILSFINLRKVEMLHDANYGHVSLNFIYASGNPEIVRITSVDRANLLIEDIYRILEEQKDEIVPF